LSSSTSAASPRWLLKRNLRRQGVTQLRIGRKELYITCFGDCATPMAPKLRPPMLKLYWPMLRPKALMMAR